MESKYGRKKLKRIALWGTSTLLVLVVAFFGFGIWSASSQLLSPSFRGVTKDLSVCEEETKKYFGEGCGNLRTSEQFVFTDVLIPPSGDGPALPGWLIKAEENGAGQAQGAIMLVHAGGSDRREMTRYIQFYLDQNLDVLTFDYSCHGEAPCPVYGLSYGERESQDVHSAYQFLTTKYNEVYAMGSSVGAASILIALPQMPDLAGAIVENPFTNFERLIKEAPEAQAMPDGFLNLLINLAKFRGGFNGQQKPENAMPLSKTTPVFFIHSKEDKTASFQQTQELFDLYAGPKTVWFPEKGEHAAIWDANRAEYESRVNNFLNSFK